jgi:hypothetical protein
MIVTAAAESNHKGGVMIDLIFDTRIPSKWDGEI